MCCDAKESFNRFTGLADRRTAGVKGLLARFYSWLSDGIPCDPRLLLTCAVTLRQSESESR